MIYLIRLTDNQICSPGVVRGAAYDGDQRIVSPAVVGWIGAGSITYDNRDKREIAVEGPAKYRIVEADNLVVPEGKRLVGGVSKSYDPVLGAVVLTAAFEDEPIVVAPAPTEKIVNFFDRAGFTLDDLRAALAELK